MPTVDTSERRSILPDLDKVPPVVSIGLAVVLWAAIFVPLLPFSVSDFNLFLKPWLAYIRNHGGFPALADSFSEYAPPYLYLLAAASYFEFPFDDQVLVKLINVPFVLMAGVAVFLICRHFERSRNFAFAAAAGALLLPTLNVNAFVWGQADVLYVPPLLLAAYLILKNRPYWAVAVFAAALSTKLQAMFLAPFMLLMVFAERIPWRAWLLAPVVYLATILPAALIGRPLGELLKTYMVQGLFYHQLAFNAPNPYFFGDFFFGTSRERYTYKIGTVIGMAIASVVGAAYSLVGVGRRNINDRAILIAAALSMTLMPYVLPKMHDRYFLGADLFTFALACVDRRFIWAAVAMQVSSLLAYAPEFALHFLPGGHNAWRWGVVAGAIINFWVVAQLVLGLKRELGPLWDVGLIKSRWREVLGKLMPTGMLGGS